MRLIREGSRPSWLYTNLKFYTRFLNAFALGLLVNNATDRAQSHMTENATVRNPIPSEKNWPDWDHRINTEMDSRQ